MNDEKCLFPRSKAHELKAGQRVLHKQCIQAPQEGKSVSSQSKTCCCLVDLFAEKKTFASSLMNKKQKLIMEDRTLERGWATLFQQNKTISDFRTDISETASTPDITGLQMVA